jgi:hypothetical protein
MFRLRLALLSCPPRRPQPLPGRRLQRRRLMPQPSEPEPEAPRTLTKSDRRALVRFLHATGLWPLRLPELEPRRKAAPKTPPKTRQPWDPRPPRDR